MYVQRDLYQRYIVSTNPDSQCLKICMKYIHIFLTVGYSWLGARRPPGGARYELYWQHFGNDTREGYTRWRAGQPSVRYGKIPEDCGELHGNEWNDIPCDVRRYVICELIP